MICYGKVCDRWVPRLMIDDHKVQRRDITSEILLRYRNEGDEFLLSIVTVNRFWFRHFNPESKQQNIEWLRLYSPIKKKL
jgi:hypothetical protein